MYTRKAVLLAALVPLLLGLGWHNIVHHPDLPVYLTMLPYFAAPLLFGLFARERQRIRLIEREQSSSRSSAAPPPAAV